MSQASVEGVFRDGGLTVVERDEVATEWKEWDEEASRNVMGKEFLRVAQMLRHRQALIAEIGRTLYEADLTCSLWYAYEILRKLTPVVYVLSKPR